MDDNLEIWYGYNRNTQLPEPITEQGSGWWFIGKTGYSCKSKERAQEVVAELKNLPERRDMDPNICHVTMACHFGKVRIMWDKNTNTGYCECCNSSHEREY